MVNKKNIKNLIFYIIAFAVIPILIAVGILFLPQKNYAIISLVIAILCNIPLLINFEKSKTNTRELVLIAVMVTLATISRLIFAPIPSFKPITAMVIITGVAFGAKAGYITGALSAVLSDVFFVAGHRTPFQILVWGLIGFFAGLLFFNKKLKMWQLLIYSVISGIVFSLIMDIWTVFAVDNSFTFLRYSQVLLASLPFMAIYAVSNFVFVLILTKPFMKKLIRIKDKFGVFSEN